MCTRNAVYIDFPESCAQARTYADAMPTRPEDLRLYRGSIGAMTAIRQHVTGRTRYDGQAYAHHPWWTLSAVPAADILRVITRLHNRYAVLASPRAKSAARSAGVGAATAHVVVHPLHAPRPGMPPPDLRIYLLASGQIEPQMQDARVRHTAVLWDGRYRLIRDSGRWTWVMTRAERDRVEASLRRAIGIAAGLPDPADAQRIVRDAARDLLGAPRFRGIKTSVLDILEVARRDARRHDPRLLRALPTPAAVRRASVHGFQATYEDRPGRPRTLGAAIQNTDSRANTRRST